MPFSNWSRSAMAIFAPVALSLGAIAQSNVKSQTVVLALRGESRVLTTTATTVSELLTEQRIALGEKERLSPSPSSRLTEGMHVTITRPDESKAPVVVMAAKPVVNRGTLSSRSFGANLARFEGKKVLMMSATGYGPGENGRWGNRTAMGGRVRYGVVAVDPRVIKLGTRLWVEGYGECLAADTGSAIKGLRIDLAFDSDRTANGYGRRKVRVVVLD